MTILKRQPESENDSELRPTFQLFIYESPRTRFHNPVTKARDVMMRISFCYAMEE